MIHRTSIFLLAAAFFLASCNGKKPSTTKKPDEEPRAPDSLEEIGTTIAGHIEIWVITLNQVQTEEDAPTAAERLGMIGQQFDLLAERAKSLPKISDAEYKRLDEKIDKMIAGVSGGLELERRRIFLLPDPIKGKVLPAHDALIKKFRDTNRAIKANSKKK